MNTAPPHTSPAWSTSCHGEDSAIGSVHTAALRDHLALCEQAGARWPAVGLAVDIVSRFVGSRLVTTLAVGAAVLGSAWLIWS